jgi:RimJ/RimL family protein N-acetyltransferase
MAKTLKHVRVQCVTLAESGRQDNPYASELVCVREESGVQPGLPELAGRRVTLAMLDENDLAGVQRWRSDPEVTRYWITRRAPSLENLRSWLDENRASGSLTWAIRDESGTLIGYCDVFGISREHRHAELALMIGERDSWGHGYARESLTVLLDHLLAPERDGGAGLHKVSLAVFAENQAARRVYSACGFKEDGVLREDMYYDGKWYDQILMSILEHEFAGSRRKSD